MRRLHEGLRTLRKFAANATKITAVALLLLTTIFAGCAEQPKGFVLKGMKGYGWTPEICLEEVPVMKELGMNFFAPCYSSFWEENNVETFEELNGYNHWWKPLDDDLQARWKMVIDACKDNGIHFCFGINPMLFSPRPLDPSSEEDFEALLAKYRWFQDQGVEWFYIAIDDLHLQSHLEIDAIGQANFTNRLYAALKEQDPDCHFIFCPTWYRGKDVDVPEKRLYLEQLAETLDKDIFVFWVGYHTVSPEISVEDVLRYKEVVKHEMILWDNYPVNDYHNTMYVAPLMGRESGICEHLYGMMANPMRDNRMTRLPLYTMADFMNNPYDYDPEASLAKAIDFVTESPAEAEVMESLVKYYSSNQAHGNRSTKYNNVRSEFERLLGEEPSAAAAYMKGLEELYQRLQSTFPDSYALSKAIIKNDLEWMAGKLN